VPQSKRHRDELINDLTVYAKLLNESETWTTSFEHVYDLLSDSEYAVSLHTFCLVMGNIPLSAVQVERLEKIQKLLEWTHPHIPDFAPFSALWHLTSIDDDSQLQVAVDDESTTTQAVEILFSTDDQKLIEALRHECVLVRVAAVTAASSEDFMQSLESRDELQLEQAIFFGLTIDDYVYSSELKEKHQEKLENFSGDSEDFYLLDAYPYTSTECRCIPGWNAIDNYFASLQFFWLDGRQQFGDKIDSDDFAFWTTEHGRVVDGGLSFDEPTFFSLALPTRYRTSYQIQCAFGALILNFKSIPGYPNGNWDIWLARWDERIDMIQSFLDRTMWAEQSGATFTKHRKYVWDYREELDADGRVDITHRILTINEDRDAYSSIEPIDFNSGFYYLRNELFGI
jgi:hypothetical protein